MKRKVSLNCTSLSCQNRARNIEYASTITMILRLVRNITKQHPKVYKPVKHVQN